MVTVEEGLSINSPSDQTDVVIYSGEIVWQPSGPTPCNYEVTLNGGHHMEGLWNGNNIFVEFGSLSEGEYIFTITLTDEFGNDVTDTVIITVTSGGGESSSSFLVFTLILAVSTLAILKKDRK